jgi:hypothetical protein
MTSRFSIALAVALSTTACAASIDGQYGVAPGVLTITE